MRTRARKDGNQSAIVSGLEAVGVLVHVMNQAHVPDLLCAVKNKGWVLLEVKNDARPPSGRKLRTGQQKFMEKFSGFPVYKVESLMDAYKVLGITVR